MSNEYKNIRHLKKYNEESRGTNSKEWVIDKGILYLFKETQIKEDGTSTNAHYSESVYSDIANVLEKNCVKVKLAIRNQKKGIITEYFLNDNEELIDFTALIQNIRQDFQPKSLKCKKTKEYYSLSLILESVKAIIGDRDQYKNIRKNIIEEIIIDSLCDHYDRNPSNFGLIKNYSLDPRKRYRLCPIFDNGTCLGASLPIEIAKKYVQDEFGIIELDNAIRSKIGIGNEKYTTYDILLDYIMKNYFEDTIDIVNDINYIIDEQTINIILNQDKYKHLDKYHKELMYKKILFNKSKINKYFKKHYKENEKKLIK